MEPCGWPRCEVGVDVVLRALVDAPAPAAQPAEEVDGHGRRLFGPEEGRPGDFALGGFSSEVAQLVPAAVALDEAALVRVLHSGELGVQPAAVLRQVLVPGRQHAMLDQQAPQVLDRP